MTLAHTPVCYTFSKVRHLCLHVHYTKKVKDILKLSRCFVQFRELALILVFKSRYLQISLTFLCTVYVPVGYFCFAFEIRSRLHR